MKETKFLEETPRQLRVSKLMKQVLAEALMSVKIKNIIDMDITVTRVTVSADLRNATIYIVPLFGQMTDEAVNRVRLASSTIARFINPKIRSLRNVPKLYFKHDNELDNYHNIMDILADLQKQSQ